MLLFSVLGGIVTGSSLPIFSLFYVNIMELIVKISFYNKYGVFIQ